MKSFLFYQENVCCVYMYLLELPHYFIEDDKTFLNCPHLPPDLVLWITLRSLHYPCLEQISMVQKMFKPLKFDCINP